MNMISGTQNVQGTVKGQWLRPPETDSDEERAFQKNERGSSLTGTTLSKHFSPDIFIQKTEHCSFLATKVLLSGVLAKQHVPFLTNRGCFLPLSVYPWSKFANRLRWRFIKPLRHMNWLPWTRNLGTCVAILTPPQRRLSPSFPPRTNQRSYSICVLPPHSSHYSSLRLLCLRYVFAFWSESFRPNFLISTLCSRILRKWPRYGKSAIAIYRLQAELITDRLFCFIARFHRYCDPRCWSWSFLLETRRWSWS